jgi:hypothetical protein
LGDLPREVLIRALEPRDDGDFRARRFRGKVDAGLAAGYE